MFNVIDENEFYALSLVSIIKNVLWRKRHWGLKLIFAGVKENCLFNIE